MKAIEAYKRFELKINKLDSGDNLDISPGEFVLIFNENQRKWYRQKTSKDDIQRLVENNISVPLLSKEERYYEYISPTDEMDHISALVKASSGSCKKTLRTYQADIKEVEFHYRDEYNKPSFDYEETFVTRTEDKLQVYRTDFEIESVLLTYYRYPKAIDIEGYKKIDGTMSINVDPELSDELTNEILDLCALEVQRSIENPNGFNLSADRTQRNINND